MVSLHRPFVYTILYYTILYYTILYYTILYYTILYCTILYYTILNYTILYYTALYYTITYNMPYHTIRALMPMLAPTNAAEADPAREPRELRREATERWWATKLCLAGPDSFECSHNFQNLHTSCLGLDASVCRYIYIYTCYPPSKDLPN